MDGTAKLPDPGAPLAPSPPGGRLGQDNQDQYVPPRGRPIADGPGKVDGGAAPPAKVDSKYWSKPGETRRVEVDGYKFDFHPKNGGGTKGEIEGRRLASGHDGVYEVSSQDKGSLEMKARFGSDDAHKSDLDVKLVIKDGQATVTGKVKDKDLGEKGVTAPVKGSGTEDDPYSVTFQGTDGKDHSLVWH
jgi:hypothetical protein